MGKKGLSKKSARVPKSSAVEQEKASSSTPKEAGSDSLSGPKKAANDSSPTPKKAGNEVDKIFAVKKRKNREQEKAEKPAEDASAKGKKLKRKKNKKKDPIESNGFVGETTQPMKRTGDGLSLYTEEELGIGNANAGDMEHQLARDLVHAGPIDLSVLYLQAEHRSTTIWDGQDLPPLQCRRSEATLRRLHAPDDRVLRRVLRAGFYGIHRIGFIRLDWHLVTALIERWRVETHTFHLPVGEATITLQDIAVLLGLPIDGAPVTGDDAQRSVSQWQDICERLLGFRPPETAIEGSRLRMSVLGARFAAPIPQDADDVTVDRYARAYILLLIGGCLFADKSQNKVQLMFLQHLEDLDDTGKLSWGSAALACLYREMCRATAPDSSDIGGPLILLQLWAWERLTHIRPDRVVPQQQITSPAVPHDTPDEVDVTASAPFVDAHVHGMANENDPLPVGPLGCRWHVSMSDVRTPRHVLRYYRDQLDQMRNDQMIWQPYNKEVLALLPLYCLSGQDMWMTRSPLICFAVVEWHFPDRVMRQFGLKQGIPEACDTGKELHATDRRGRSGCDWRAAHRSFVDKWEQRREHIVTGEALHHPIDLHDPYMVWYNSITRRLIGPPIDRPGVGFQPMASIIELLERTITHMCNSAQDALEGGTDVTHYVQALQNVRALGSTCLEAIGEQHRLDHRCVPIPHALTPMPKGQKLPRLRRRRPRRSADVATCYPRC
ncbi:unnamed protein product [Ilex paraguariensis]|uniref:Aminotransferase-like plant mobile domain-containing protein n=1 Tax=Ilex paraguariensis TaxID=185542 RepID=A0ABC8TFR3_9AQUA